jgi:low affinity Fe/Cu permease
LSASTSTASLIIVLLLQATQHRDTRAIQLKLNELLRAVETARTDLVHLEHRSDEERSAVQQEFAHLEADGATSARCNGDSTMAGARRMPRPAALEGGLPAREEATLKWRWASVGLHRVRGT